MSSFIHISFEDNCIAVHTDLDKEDMSKGLKSVIEVMRDAEPEAELREERPH
jgi:hypothetical protein